MQNNKLLQLFRRNRRQRKIDTTIIHQLLNQNIPQNERMELQATLGFHEKVEKCLAIMNQPVVDWNTKKINNSGSISTKVVQKGEVKVRLEAQIPVNLENLALMINDTEIYKNWLLFCTQSKDIVADPRITLLKFKLPFVSQRQGYFFGQSLNRIDSHDSVIFFCESKTGSKLDQDKYGVSLQKSQKSVELIVKFFIVEFRLIHTNLYHMRSYAHVDLQMSFLPEMVVNMLSGYVGNFMLDKMVEYSNRGTQWDHLKGSEFHKWLKDIVVGWEESKKKMEEIAIMQEELKKKAQKSVKIEQPAFTDID